MRQQLTPVPTDCARPMLPPHCSLRMYNNLVERCFKDCVDTFRRKDLDATEEKVCRRGPAGVAGWAVERGRVRGGGWGLVVPCVETGHGSASRNCR